MGEAEEVVWTVDGVAAAVVVALDVMMMVALEIGNVQILSVGTRTLPGGTSATGASFLSLRG